MNQSFGQSDTPDERPQPIFFARKEFDGTNSEIREHHYPDGKRLVVTRLGARKGGFSFDEAHEIVDNAKQYHDELIALGVPLPDIEQLYVEYEPSLDRSVVVKASPWAGHEVKKLITESDPETDKEKILELTQSMVDITRRIADQRHQDFSLTVGIDPQPSNFIVDNEGVMRYVDLFPTRIRKNGEPIVEWPAPQTKLGHELGHFKHFDIRGIILTMTAQLARLQPKLKDQFETIVAEGFKEHLTTDEQKLFQEDLTNTPWQQIRKHLQSKETGLCIDCLDNALTERPFGVDYNVYTLREIALELTATGHLTDEELSSFFSASHFEDELPAEKLQELHAFLKDKI